MIIEFLLDGAHSHLPRVIVTRVIIISMNL